MNLIVFLPFFLSIFFCLYKTPQYAFINVYIPFLLFLPFEDYVHFPALHSLNFAHLAIIPIFFFFIFSSYFRKAIINWRFSLTEVLILLYFIECTYSEYIGEVTGMDFGGSMSLNLAMYMLVGILMPYFLGKYLIFPSKSFVLFARRYVIYLLIVLVLCAYEWRMTESLFMKFVNIFYNNQFLQIIPIRSGLVRITGPFTHPILFGIILGTAFLLNYWLTVNNYWKKNFSFLPPLYFSKGTIISVLLFIGMILTLSRGPIYSTMVVAMFIGLGQSRYKLTKFFIRLVILGIVGIFAYGYYSQIGIDDPSGDLEGSAFYRLNLYNTYKEIILEKFWLGWGSLNWYILNLDRAGGMESIDNHYMWLALKHGFISVILLCSIILINSFKLLYQGLSKKTNNKNSLALTLFSIVTMIALSVYTVYMGAQVEPIFFMFIGMSEGFLAIKNSEINDYLSFNLKNQNSPSIQED